MANNYTPSYNQYRTQTAGYALPSSVRTYSVFDPASNSWRRMTNDGRSPMPASPVQQQADIAGALAQARQTQGTVYPAGGMGQGQPVEVHPGYLNPPVQSPAQMPSGGPRMPSQPLPRGGAVPVQGQPANESVAEAMSLRGPSTNASGISLNPNLNYAFRSNFENFQQEIPRSNAYGPLQNPRTVRNMSPDYQEASTAPVAVAQPTPVAPVQPATSVAVPLAASHRPTVSIYDVIQQEHDNIPERLHQFTPSGLMGGIRSGLTRNALPYLQDRVLGLLGRTEPLARATRVTGTAASRSRLTPEAQRIADFLKR